MVNLFILDFYLITPFISVPCIQMKGRGYLSREQINEFGV